jgi:transposase
LVSFGPGVERLEVLSGSTGRRHWPDEVKARIVAETLERGVRVKEVAARHGIQPQQVTAWRRLVRKGELAIPAERETEFAALVIEPPMVEGRTPAPLVGVVEIAVGDVVVRLSGDAPVERIAAIARALRP